MMSSKERSALPAAPSDRAAGFSATRFREYLARHSPDEITEAMNKACAEIGDSAKTHSLPRLPDVFLSEASGDLPG